MSADRVGCDQNIALEREVIPESFDQSLSVLNDPEDLLALTRRKSVPFAVQDGVRFIAFRPTFELTECLIQHGEYGGDCASMVFADFDTRTWFLHERGSVWNKNVTD